MRQTVRRALRLAAALALVLPLVVPPSAPSVGATAAPSRVASMPAAVATAPAPSVIATGPAVDSHILVSMKPGRSASMLAGRYGVSASGISSSGRVVTVRVPAGKSAAQLAAELAQDPDVAGSSQDFVRRPTGSYTSTPNDSAYIDGTPGIIDGVTVPFARSWWERDATMSAMWGALGASTYGPRATGDAIKVAVIDTGFYTNHPDAGSHIVAGKDEFESYSFATGRYTTDMNVSPASPQASGNDTETASHGTCVAGEISAATNNGVGVAGVSWDTTVLVYKVMGTTSDSGYVGGELVPKGTVLILDSAIVNAINDATKAGAKVISMSLGGEATDTVLQAAIDNAYQQGVLVCAATGNGTNNDGVGKSGVEYPARGNHVVGVGAYQLGNGGTRQPCSFSNWGPGLDVLAPGLDVWGMTAPNYNQSGTVGYGWWSGTSMATPAFAGMAALVWRFAPALSVDEITTYMETNASPGSSSSRPSSDFGWGYANPTAAYASLKSDFAYLATPTVTASALTSRSVVPVRWNTVNGRGVTYDVTLDGAKVASATASTATTLTLADGAHAVVVTPRSVYNWTSGAGTTATVVVDTVAPTISGLAVDPVTDVVSWTTSEAGKPSTTLYSVDGDTTRTISGTTYDPAAYGLSVGVHTFNVQVVDAAGNASASRSVRFTYDGHPAAPVVTSATTSTATYTLTWQPIIGADTYQVRLNGAALADTAGLSATMTLAGGPNDVGVRTVSTASGSTMYSAWATVTVTYTMPLPGRPSGVSVDSSVTSQPTATVAWGQGDYALSYEYHVNNGEVVNVGLSEYVTIALAKGQNSIGVRSRNTSGVSTWTPVNLTFAPPAPAAPTLAESTIGTALNSVTLSWGAVRGAVSYDYRLGAGSYSTTAATGVSLAGVLVAGTNVLGVRSRSAYDDTSQWATVTVTYTPPTISPVVLGSQGRIVATLWASNGLPLAEAPVLIEQSYDGISWSQVAETTSTLSGLLDFTVKPSRITYYRLTYADGVSVVVRADVKPLLYTPVAASRHTRSGFTVYGYLKPRHAAGARNVRIKAYLYNTHSHTYVLKRTFTLKNYNYSSYTKYSGRIALPYTGTWHLYAYYSQTTSFVSATSGYRKVVIR
jgi:subtilisin family serine protease